MPTLLTLGTDDDGTLPAHASEQPDVFEDVPRSADDLAAVLYTSGTTGRSKGAMLSHGNLTSNAAALAQAWQFTPNDVLLHALPIFHTHGLFVATNVVLMAGASMLYLPKFDPNEIFRLLPRATTMMGVPTFYVRLLDDARLTREATAQMRLFVSGSAPLLPDTHRGFLEKTGHSILERYGMTETGMNTSNPYEGERVPGTVGLPLPGVDVRVANPETGETLGPEDIGMIEVRGPNVCKGYWRMPDKTKAEFRDDGFFITGDLGKIDCAVTFTSSGAARISSSRVASTFIPRKSRARSMPCSGWSRAPSLGCLTPTSAKGLWLSWSRRRAVSCRRRMWSRR